MSRSTSWRPSLAASLGVAETVFATPAQRAFVRRVDDGLAEVEHRLATELTFADAVADASGRYLAEAGGKRIRPALTLIASQLGEGATEEVLLSAMAVEITHLASLYHDDVMDDAAVRRGVSSAQMVWGNSVAILTGDLLFARASRITGKIGDEAYQLQGDTFERLCLGQLHETVGPSEGDDPIAHYLQVLSDKTGSLIASAAESGVRFSGADRAYIEPLRDYGEKVGVAFQLIDDVIDLSDRTDVTGKLPGTDLRAGVVTLPLLYLRHDAARDANAALLLERLDTALAALDGSESAELALRAVIDDVRRSDATARTVEEARRWSREAVAHLAPLPDGPVRTALERFAERVIERDA